MDVGKIVFSPRFESAIAVLKDEAINSKLWEEMYRSKEYECETLKDEIKKLRKKK